MRKVISILLILCICLSTLTACDALSALIPLGTEKETEEGKETGKETEPATVPQDSGLYIPDRMTVPVDGTTQEVELLWTNNSCTFTAAETEFVFTFDESTRTLDCAITRSGETTSLDDVCVFDDQGRVLRINFEGRTALSISYENGKTTILSCFGEKNFAPMELTVNWETREALMPPFDDPDNMMTFTEQGDLIGGEGALLCTYAYDDEGNITSASLGDTAFVLHYSTTPLTASWQKCPLKIVLMYVYGWPYAVFAMDMLCMSLHIQHDISNS